MKHLGRMAFHTARIFLIHYHNTFKPSPTLPVPAPTAHEIACNTFSFFRVLGCAVISAYALYIFAGRFQFGPLLTWFSVTVIACAWQAVSALVGVTITLRETYDFIPTLLRTTILYVVSIPILFIAAIVIHA